MRLRVWQKIFLPVLLLIAAAVTAVTAFFNVRYTGEALESAKAAAADAHAHIASSIAAAVKTEIYAEGRLDLGEDAVRSAAVSVMPESGAALYKKGQTLFTGSAGLVSPESEKVYTRLYTENGKYIFALQSPVRLCGAAYALVTETDLTEVYAAAMSRTRVSALLCAGVSAASAVLLALTLGFIFKPLDRLRRTVGKIADGDYSARTGISSGDELGKLARDTDTMAEAIEKSVTRLNQAAETRQIFIDDLSHEMKTPLTSILGYADLIRITPRLPDGKRIEYANVIVGEAARLRSLSNKLMELISVGGTDRRDMRVCPADDIVSSLATVMEPSAAKRGISIDVRTGGGEISADRALFDSMLVNISDNAIKASPDGGRIVLSCGTALGGTWFSVQDFGIGIPKKELDKITEPFYMVDKSRSRRQGGAGLGLALCVRIAKLHHAELKIVSEEGKGTTVVVFVKPPRNARESR